MFDIYRLILAIFILVYSFCGHLYAQEPNILNQYELKAYSADQIVTDKLISAVINEVGEKTIIGLGEGTHGTAEFNQVRAAVSRRLIEEKGFQYICFENNYGETFFFNNRMQHQAYTGALLKQHFIGIYQTKEIDDFFQWLTGYNREHPDKGVKVSGLDFFELTAAVDIVEQHIINKEDYQHLLTKLRHCIKQQDSLRNNQLSDTALFRKTTLQAYQLLSDLEKDSDIKVKDSLLYHEALYNLKVRNEFYYEAYQHPEQTRLDRDLGMANMLHFIRKKDPEAKIIIWAHNAHVSHHYVYGKGRNGGGMGGYIADKFPEEYLTISTTTSEGTFRVTEDAYPTRFNQFTEQAFPRPPKGSLERLLYGQYKAAVYGKGKNTGASNKTIKMMFPGHKKSLRYTPTFEIQLNNYFDVLYHIPKTKPSTEI
ncbi:erythromycin esterase family protein [Olivibacter sp. SA151]|uniref:erythromycin esterase family protein n=1 Tax=Olivibacter jilunii TaxID=985016 RepID=UPI003F145B54